MDLANKLYHKHRDTFKKARRSSKEDSVEKRQFSRKHMSISFRSQKDKAIIEFPIQSARDDLDSRDEMHPTFDNQVIVHQQYMDRTAHKQIKASTSFRIRDKQRIFDPVETEFERLEDTHYMDIQKSPT